MRRRSILTTVLAAILSAAITASTARAQAELPREIVEATTVTAAQATEIDTYIRQRLPGLNDNDPAVVIRSRNELLSPFKNTKVAVAFRQAYAKTAVPELTRFADGKDDFRVVNCLRIAGEIATADATAILERKLNDPRPAVRFAAVNGLERTMSAVATRTPAMTAEQLQVLVDKLGQIISDPKNSDYKVVDAAERALISAMNVTIGNVRSRAFQNLSSSVSKLAKRFADQQTPPQVRIILVRAGDATSKALGAIPNPLAGESIKDAAALSGHLLGWSMCQLKGGHLAAEDARADAANIATVSENNVIIASGKANVAPPAPQKLGESLAKGNNDGDNLFVRNIGNVVGPMKAGFRLNDDFLACRALGPG